METLENSPSSLSTAPAVSEQIPVIGAARDNNFSLLRLIFAALVVISHSPQLIDGNEAREPLSRFVGTQTLGEIAVDGFFLVSGYLITKSFCERPAVVPYMIKRVARIVPGYAVSFLLCAFVLAPFAGASHSAFAPFQIRSDFFHFCTLSAPQVKTVFPGLPYPDLNGPMWTIAYEFRCYLAVAVVGALCMLLRLNLSWSRWLLLLIVPVGLALASFGFHFQWGSTASFVFGNPRDNISYLSIFCIGALYYLFRDRIVLAHYGALIAAALFFAALCNDYTAAPGTPVFGGYLVFWFALKLKCFKASLIAAKNDISYGLYLYAWPIQKIVTWNYRTIDPWVLSLVTLALAGLAGYISWHLIEKRALACAHGLRFPSTKCS